MPSEIPQKLREIRHRYYLKHREKILEYERIWRQENLELVREKSRQAYAKKKDDPDFKARKKTNMIKYRTKNRERYLEKQREYNRRYKEKHRDELNRKARITYQAKKLWKLYQESMEQEKKP